MVALKSREENVGEGNGNALQCAYLGIPMDRGVWQTRVHGVARAGHGLATEQACVHLDGGLDAAVNTCPHLVGRCGMVRGGTFWAQAVPP